MSDQWNLSGFDNIAFFFFFSPIVWVHEALQIRKAHPYRRKQEEDPVFLPFWLYVKEKALFQPIGMLL